jgi:biopolymer transport protein ExbB
MPTALQALGQLPPPDLNAWQMFLSADAIVKTVMAILMLASVASWTILVAKGFEIRSARRLLKAQLAGATGASGLDALAFDAPMLEAARAECSLSGALPPSGIRERIALRLHRIEAQAARRLGFGTGVLASIGSCAPFIGLFGTVWGIMNAFVGIARSQTTSLAVVAPGIAEALLATAAGLVAAIPAVLIYNLFSRLIASYRAELADLSAAIQVLVSRDLDRRAVPARSRPHLRDAAD